MLRGNGSSLRGIAAVNGASSIGLLAGPIVAGLLTQHSVSATAVAAAVAALAVLPTRAMDYAAPANQQSQARLRDVWRIRSVLAGYWASATGGAWSGLVNSYAPVVLARAGQSSSTIGFLISCANAANILGSVIIGRLSRRHVTTGYVACTATAGIGTVLVGLTSGIVPLTSAALVVSGFGAGTLLTLGPSLATDGVRPESRPDALAAAGTFRSAALFATPLGIAVLSHVLPLGLAVAALGIPIMLTTLHRPEPGQKR